MDFSQELFDHASKFRSQYSEIVNLGIDIDNVLVSFHEINSFGLIYGGLINSVRRNFLLGSFLYESGQCNSGVQVSRTMIESTEILLAYIIDSKGAHDLVLESLRKPAGDKILESLRNKIIMPYIKGKDEESELSNSILNLKNQMNSLLAHANPAYNLAHASGIKQFGKEFWATNSDIGDDVILKDSYIIHIITYFHILELVQLVAQIFGAKIFLNQGDGDKLSEKIRGIMKKYVSWKGKIS